MAHADAHHGHAEVQPGAHVQGQQHPLGIYFKIWGLLFVLSIGSYLVDYFHFQGLLRWFLIITFMLLKAGLIVAVFMHMMWERMALMYAIVIPPLLLLVLLGIGALRRRLPPRQTGRSRGEYLPRPRRDHAGAAGSVGGDAAAADRSARQPGQRPRRGTTGPPRPRGRPRTGRRPYLAPYPLRSLVVAPAVYIIAGEGIWWLYTWLLHWYKQRDVHRICLPGPNGHQYCAGEGQIVVTAALIVFLAAVGVGEANRYFYRWAQNPATRAEFTGRYVDIARQLLSLPPSALKYVVVTRGDVKVNGIPMSAQTVMYLTDTSTAGDRVNIGIDEARAPLVMVLWSDTRVFELPPQLPPTMW